MLSQSWVFQRLLLLPLLRVTAKSSSEQKHQFIEQLKKTGMKAVKCACKAH
jgi:hypothetical protein